MLYNIKPNKGTNKNKEENSMKEFYQTIFPDVSIHINNLGWLHGLSIIAHKKGWVPGIANKLTSADTIKDYYDIIWFNVEYISTLCPNDFPRNIISLKVGMVMMLL